MIIYVYLYANVFCEAEKISIYGFLHSKNMAFENYNF